MPALVSHYLFALRVFAKLKKAGVPPADRDAALIGAQGPDLFFFHRVLPWQTGRSMLAAGRQMHTTSPARILEEFRLSLRAACPDGVWDSHMLGYVEGFICHYALDRSAHPYVYDAQERLQREDPGYGGSGDPLSVSRQYHFRIESALDTMTLRRETGRLMSNFSLPSTLPPAGEDCCLAIGRLYRPIMRNLFGISAEPELLAKAPADMRLVLRLINDRSLSRQRLLHPFERLIRRGHFVTSLLRPAETDDWDYANLEHRRWENPYNTAFNSRDSFFDIFDHAANEAADMIVEFLESLTGGRAMEDITQDRGFHSDLPGMYEPYMTRKPKEDGI